MRRRRLHLRRHPLADRRIGDVHELDADGAGVDAARLLGFGAVAGEVGVALGGEAAGYLMKRIELGF